MNGKRSKQRKVAPGLRLAGEATGCAAFWRPKERAGQTEPGRGERGFTLLELIIVIAIIGILATIAMPALKDVPRRANEAVLKTNLHTLRDVIDQYYGDKGKYPTSLEQLVETHYLRKVPNDPMTKRNDTWTFEYEQTDPDSPPPESDSGEASPGITDVHSGSPLLALDGTPYKDW